MGASEKRAISRCRRLTQSASPHCADLRRCERQMHRIFAKKSLPKAQRHAAYDVEDELQHKRRAHACGLGRKR